MPVVQLGLTGFDTDVRDSVRLSLQATHINEPRSQAGGALQSSALLRPLVESKEER